MIKVVRKCHPPSIWVVTMNCLDGNIFSTTSINMTLCLGSFYPFLLLVENLKCYRFKDTTFYAWASFVKVMDNSEWYLYRTLESSFVRVSIPEKFDRKFCLRTIGTWSICAYFTLFAFVMKPVFLHYQNSIWCTVNSICKLDLVYCKLDLVYCKLDLVYCKLLPTQSKAIQHSLSHIF